MENRILIIADELFGENGESAARFSELLLCKQPTRPLQFVINAPLSYSLASLNEKIAFDIMGKQAKHIILGVGLKELAHGKNPDTLFESLKNITSILLSKTSSIIYIVTIPLETLPESPSAVCHWNTLLKGLAADRLNVLDFAEAAETFKEQQLERGKFARTLYGETGKPTSTCQTLLSLFLLDTFLA